MNDIGQCPDCCEVVEDGFQYHESCCPHDDTEERDDRDGVAGTVWVNCCQCGDDVTREAHERADDRHASEEYDRMRDERGTR